MKRRNAFIIFTAAVVLAGCSSLSIKDCGWLIGKWRGQDVNDLVFLESWENGEGGSYNGNSVTISPEGDTLWKESLKIEVVEGTPYYVTNDPKTKTPVLFKMIESDPKKVVFENKDRKFPRRVSYQLETNTTMKVKLEGIENGVPKVETLLFEREKNESQLLR
jgi:hypothetical protein